MSNGRWSVIAEFNADGVEGTFSFTVDSAVDAGDAITKAAAVIGTLGTPKQSFSPTVYTSRMDEEHHGMRAEVWWKAMPSQYENGVTLVAYTTVKNVAHLSGIPVEGGFWGWMKRMKGNR